MPQHRRTASAHFGRIPLLLATLLVFALCGVASAATYHQGDLQALREMYDQNPVLRESIFFDLEFAADDWQTVTQAAWGAAGICWTPDETDRRVYSISWEYYDDDDYDVIELGVGRAAAKAAAKKTAPPAARAAASTTLDFSVFDSLRYLTVDYFTLDNPPMLPDSLLTLSLSICGLTALPDPLPDSLLELHCYYNELTELPDLPDGLLNLQCYGNRLTALPDLPTGLYHLDAESNPIDEFPDELPASLVTLWAQNTNITSLPQLPATLRELFAENLSLNALEIRLPSNGQLTVYSESLLLDDVIIEDSDGEVVVEVFGNTIYTTDAPVDAVYELLGSLPVTLTVVDDFNYSPRDIALLQSMYRTGEAPEIFADLAFAADDWQAVPASVFEAAGIVWTAYSADLEETPDADTYLSGLEWTDKGLSGTLTLRKFENLDYVNIDANDDLEVFDMIQYYEFNLLFSVPQGDVLHVYGGKYEWQYGDQQQDGTTVLNVYGEKSGYAGPAVYGITESDPDNPLLLASYTESEEDYENPQTYNVHAYTRPGSGDDPESRLMFFYLDPAFRADIEQTATAGGYAGMTVFPDMPLDFIPAQVPSADTPNDALASSFSVEVDVTESGNMLPMAYFISGTTLARTIGNYAELADEDAVLAALTQAGINFTYQYGDGSLVPIIGPNGLFSWAEARDRVAAQVDSDMNLLVTYVVADADSALPVLLADYAVIIPDGVQNDVIFDPPWLIKGNSGNDYHSSSGCASAGFGLFFAAVVVLTASRARKR